MADFRIDFKDKSATRAVIEAIQRFIVENRLGPGDALPGENDIAERLGVSRTIIREALQYFKALGIIETRRKAGMRIRRLVPDNPFGGYLPYIGGDQERLADLLETRKIIELGMVPELVRRVTPDAAKKLRDISEKMAGVEAEADSGPLDIAFHHILLDIVNNPLLSSLRPLIVDHFALNHRQRVDQRIDGAKNRKNHLDIVDALEKGDETMARTAFLRHYHVYE